jgi:hypothetical protein
MSRVDAVWERYLSGSCARTQDHSQETLEERSARIRAEKKNGIFHNLQELRPLGLYEPIDKAKGSKCEDAAPKEHMCNKSFPHSPGQTGELCMYLA